MNKFVLLMKILNGNQIDIYETRNIDQGDVHLNQGLTVQMNNQDLLFMKIEFLTEPREDEKSSQRWHGFSF